MTPTDKESSRAGREGRIAVADQFLGRERLGALDTSGKQFYQTGVRVTSGCGCGGMCKSRASAVL